MSREFCLMIDSVMLWCCSRMTVAAVELATRYTSRGTASVTAEY